MTRQFSFFTRGYLGSYGIRGHQIGERLGARINPDGGYKKDTCIWVKPRNVKETEYSWIDPLDSTPEYINKYHTRYSMRLGVIAASLSALHKFDELYPGRKKVFIPQHHCNFDNEIRPNRIVLSAGCVGDHVDRQFPNISKMMNDIGVEWKFLKRIEKREYSTQFYKTIDIQVVYRPKSYYSIPYELGNTLKLANAGSYGIPTVAFPEPGFVMEWKDEALYGETIDEIIKQVKRLKNDNGLYMEMSNRALSKSKEYDIEKIANRYINLLGG